MISIVVPAFNEEEGLRRLLPRIPRRLLGDPVSIVVVSDGSSDRTAEVASGFGAIVVSLPANRGKAAALRAGIERTRGFGWAALVTMDGDGQHDPRDLERLVAPVLAGGCDLAIGSRYLVDAARGSTPYNRFLVRRALIGRLRSSLGAQLTDPLCGFRCFSPKALDRLRLEGDRYEVELSALFESASAGLRLLEVPVARIYGPGTSKMGARWGRPIGRLLVLGQYLRATSRGVRALRRAGRPPLLLDRAATLGPRGGAPRLRPS